MRKLIPALLFGFMLFAIPAHAQLATTGTPHGILVGFTAGTAGSNPVAGVNLYRITGACSVSNLPGGSPINAAVIAGASYLDPSSGLAAGTTYCYGASTVDTKGNQSPFATVTVVVPSSGFPVNPSVPANVSATVQ